MLNLLLQTGTTVTDQMDLLHEQVKMLAGEVALCVSSLKRVSEQSVKNPENLQLQVSHLLTLNFIIFSQIWWILNVYMSNHTYIIVSWLGANAKLKGWNQRKKFSDASSGATHGWISRNDTAGFTQYWDFSGEFKKKWCLIHINLWKSLEFYRSIHTYSEPLKQLPNLEQG